MGQQSLVPLLGKLRRWLGTPGHDAASDGQLLEQFVVRQDQPAFAALMRRHGPLVLGVCRRTLGDSHDAEDAFQATFVVLARRAGGLYGEGSLAGWLHAVATRIALKARTHSARRLERERTAAAEPGTIPEAAMPSRIEPWLQAADREARSVLDEALNHLPDKYRLPLVLCYLEGKTNEEAALELGCPVGSMSWKLEKGRDLLRQRLGRRGMALGGAALATLLTEQTATADIPTALFDITQQAVSLLLTGQGPAGLLSSQALTLADGMVRAVIWSKIQLAAMGVLMISLVGLGIGVLAYPLATPEATTAPPPNLELALVRQVSATVADWQPTADERRFDQIGWSRELVPTLALAAEHGRPVFLITHEGDMARGRSCGGSSAMRAGALSNPEIIELLNRHFVPLYVNSDLKNVSAPEKAERQRLYQAALQADLPAGSHAVSIISPQGQVVDAMPGCKIVSVDAMLQFLCCHVKADANGEPLVAPRPQSAPAAAPPGSLVLHLTARYLTPQGRPLAITLGERRVYSWNAYPAEDWLVWSPAEAARLLPATAEPGHSWALNAELLDALFRRCYPCSEENDPGQNRIDEQVLTATIVARQGDRAWARLTGRLRMNHPFYPGMVDERHVDADLSGFLEFDLASRRIRQFQLSTPKATYGQDRFGVAIGSNLADDEPARPR